jgi:SAM-dependent methyltransferase
MRFLQVQPTATTLARMYGAEYFESDFRCGRSDARASDELAFRAENDGLLDRFERYRGRGRLLDVGCANGLLVKRACERAWAAQGVELSAEAVARARALGVQVREGTLRDAAFPDASFDLVYTGDVLEHVPDCREVAAEVARVLAPGGHWFLRGPITTHSLARSLALAVAGRAGRAIVLREPPYHLWEFTPGPLAALMRRVGLEVVAVEQAKIAPGAAHGQKSALQRAALFVLDSVNLPLTRLLNARGDRVVLVARRP